MFAKKTPLNQVYSDRLHDADWTRMQASGFYFALVQNIISFKKSYPTFDLKSVPELYEKEETENNVEIPFCCLYYRS